MLITFHLFPHETFQTFNVHQVLLLKEAVVNWGQLWSNSCFAYKHFNRDLWGYFQGSQTIQGQVSKLCFLSS